MAQKHYRLSRLMLNKYYIIISLYNYTALWWWVVIGSVVGPTLISSEGISSLLTNQTQSFSVVLSVFVAEMWEILNFFREWASGRCVYCTALKIFMMMRSTFLSKYLSTCSEGSGAVSSLQYLIREACFILSNFGKVIQSTLESRFTRPFGINREAR